MDIFKFVVPDNIDGRGLKAILDLEHVINNNDTNNDK